ncbi:hypothetical protein BST81_16850 [Leptolyngbya sp. 'hensonii']|nr:hypothetical protein BST81_16850 [Leptolyngbya sp. 'hensonii']
MQQFERLVTASDPHDPSLTPQGDRHQEAVELSEVTELVAEAEEDDEDDIPDILATRTRHSATQNPLSKLLLVGVASGAIFLLAGTLLMTLTSSKGHVTARNTSGAPAPAPAEPEPAQGALSDSKDQMVPGEYKTAAALANQDKDLTQLNERLKQGNLSGTPGSAGTTPPKTLAVPTTTPTALPPPVPAPRPAYQTVPVSTVPAVASTPIAPNQIPIPVDPDQEWKRLSQAGSYGMVPPVPAQVAMAPTVPAVSAPVTGAQPSGQGGGSSMAQPSQQSASSLVSYLGGLSSQTEQAYSQIGVPPTPDRLSNRVLLVGTRSRATLLTDAVWANSGDAPSFGGTDAAPKFIVQLEEPLRFTDGSIAIPQGALLVSVIRPLEKKTGLATMDVVAIIINNKEYNPPTSAITLRGPEGSAIVADRFDKGAQIAGLDTTLILTSALSGIGTVMNQASSSSSVSTNGTTTTTSTTPPPNYLGAAMSQGFGAFADTLKKRNEAAVQQIMAQPDVFYIPKGKSLQLFVNQTISL